MKLHVVLRLFLGPRLSCFQSISSVRVYSPFESSWILSYSKLFSSQHFGQSGCRCSKEQIKVGTHVQFVRKAIKPIKHRSSEYGRCRGSVTAFLNLGPRYTTFSSQIQIKNTCRTTSDRIQMCHRRHATSALIQKSCQLELVQDGCHLEIISRQLPFCATLFVYSCL